MKAPRNSCGELVFLGCNVKHQGNFKNLIGKRFGRLVAVKRVENSGRRTMWQCLCQCGSSKVIMSENLTAKRTQSCGCLRLETTSKRNLINLVGRKFGKLTVIERLAKPKASSAYWRCRCACGKEKKTFSYNLLRGFTNSCGCLVTQGLKARRLDFLGKRIGKLIIIKDMGINRFGDSLWKYRCECGNVGVTRVSELKTIKSCGCKIDRSIRRRGYNKFLNQKFHFLKIVKILRNEGRAQCLAECQCGKVTRALIDSIVANKKISCGCKTYNTMTKEEKIKYLGVEKYRQMVQTSIKNSTETFLRKYNVRHPSQDNEIALKIARKTKHASLKRHWKTKKMLVCQASWEKAVVEYLNKNKIDFDWQITFKMPDDSTYRVDLYLKKENLFVEIKGYMREVALQKWTWFHKNYPNSELWTKDVLVAKGIKIA